MKIYKIAVQLPFVDKEVSDNALQNMALYLGVSPNKIVAHDAQNIPGGYRWFISVDGKSSGVVLDYDSSTGEFDLRSQGVSFKFKDGPDLNVIPGEF